MFSIKNTLIPYQKRSDHTRVYAGKIIEINKSDPHYPRLTFQDRNGKARTIGVQQDWCKRYFPRAGDYCVYYCGSAVSIPKKSFDILYQIVDTIKEPAPMEIHHD